MSKQGSTTSRLSSAAKVTAIGALTAVGAIIAAAQAASLEEVENSKVDPRIQLATKVGTLQGKQLHQVARFVHDNTQGGRFISSSYYKGDEDDYRNKVLNALTKCDDSFVNRLAIYMAAM